MLSLDRLSSRLRLHSLGLRCHRQHEAPAPSRLQCVTPRLKLVAVPGVTRTHRDWWACRVPLVGLELLSSSVVVAASGARNTQGTGGGTCRRRTTDDQSLSALAVSLPQSIRLAPVPCRWDSNRPSANQIRIPPTPSQPLARHHELLAPQHAQPTADATLAQTRRGEWTRGCQHRRSAASRFPDIRIRQLPVCQSAHATVGPSTAASSGGGSCTLLCPGGIASICPSIHDRSVAARRSEQRDGTDEEPASCQQSTDGCQQQQHRRCQSLSTW